MTLRTRAAYLLATWFGCGYSPVAPGTVGSIGTIPLHLLLSLGPIWLHVSVTVVIAAVGLVVSQIVSDDRNDKDPSLVVIDEVLGTLIAMGVVRSQAWWLQLLALAAFRLFDITKPPPIRQAERQQPAGLGIMLDDLLAGLVAAALVWGLARFAGWLT